MTPRNLLRIALSTLLAATALAQEVSTDRPVDPLAMGKMWTFENPPLAYLEKEYGFKPDQKWLDSLRLSALRVGTREQQWCSAAFVSPQGLIMTNHHCVREQIERAQQDQDWVNDGFAAKALDDEVKLAMGVQQLIAQQDVTAKVNDGIGETDDDVTITRKREENTKKTIAAAVAAQPQQLHQVVTLYQGAVYQLYSYKVYDDVRLVLAPNLQIAYFGGDPDNFTYPRYDVDFTFVRAYENDKPADTSANYFRFRADGPKDGELVFVPGNPGSTNRLLTTAQLEYQRDVEYPMIIEEFGRALAITRPFATKENAGLMVTVLEWENSYKAISGQLDGLRDRRLFALKAVHEQQFRAAVQQRPELQRQYGAAWDKLAAAAQQKRVLQPRTKFHQAAFSTAIERGVAICRAVDDSLPDEERASARDAALGMRVSALNMITRPLLIDHFRRARKWLPAGDPFLKALFGDDDDPAAVVKRLDKSKLNREATVKRLLDGGKDAVAESDDPALVAARALVPLQRDNEAQEQALDGVWKAQGTLLGRALFEVYGSKVSPDATMTLRFSDGVVQGYPYNGTLAPWATSFYGLYARHTEFGGVFPFDLPEPWLKAESRIDLTKKVDFVCTNDIVGGNSGSSVVDKELNVVGLIFDGNIESLPNDYYFTQDRPRAVSVHANALLVALQQVYDGQRIADELLAGRRPAGEPKPGGDGKPGPGKDEAPRK
ncbi:MAG TPA: S46 family peptidase [Planctomycetota bacterium]|nr:S46 family peptidase [Planctomycetota bacterium]